MAGLGLMDIHVCTFSSLDQDVGHSLSKTSEGISWQCK